LQGEFEGAKDDSKRANGEVQRLKIRIQHLESLVAASGAAQAAAAVSSAQPSAQAAGGGRGDGAAAAAKPVASPSTLQELSFNCRY